MIILSSKEKLQLAAACGAVMPQHKLPMATKVAKVGGSLGMPVKKRRTRVLVTGRMG